MKRKVKKMVDGKEVEVEEDYEEEKSNTLPEGLAAKRFILESSGVMSHDQVAHINSVIDAELLIEHFGLGKKNAAPDEAPKPKGSVGPVIPFKDNPDPRKNRSFAPENMKPYSVEELLDPLQTDNSRLNRYLDGENVRIIRHYSDQYLEGRLI